MLFLNLAVRLDRDSRDAEFTVSVWTDIYGLIQSESYHWKPYQRFVRPTRFIPPQEGWREKHGDTLRLESKVDSVTDASSGGNIPAPHFNSWTRGPAEETPSTSPVALAFLSRVPPESQRAFSILHLYQTEMAPMFPFVIIPPDMTPSDILAEKPLLYWAIMVVGCQDDVDEQLVLADLYREELSSKALVKGETTLGSLQSLLIYLAWNHNHVKVSSQIQLPLLLHLAFALVVILELNKEPRPRIKTELGGLRLLGLLPQSMPEKTLEERRTLLGVLWICSVLATTIKDVPGMRFDALTDHHCAALETAMQFSSDRYLIRLVRIQQLAETIRATLYDDAVVVTGPGMAAAIATAVSSFDNDVKRIGGMISADPTPEPLMRMSYHMLQIYLYKVALDSNIFPSTRTGTTPPPSSDRIVKRNQFLVSCLAAIEASTEIFLAMPPTLILSLPYYHWAQLGQAIVVLSRILTVRRECVDFGLIMSVSTFLDTTAKIKDKLDAVAASAATITPARRLPRVFDNLGIVLVEASRSITESLEDASGSFGSATRDVGDGALSEATMLLDGDIEAILFTLFTNEQL
ncbi:uncharacterized protein DNG_07241 [Cephalotrichum gorgonifer]|uniref:Transcription factor domain-containing protein n=1 Tax=Cephalotrichum gorgonifer TaxID=2041049 RepID=A0AAE8N1B0_9PEZI|nr:uncharacterized protein DNG_07241 [Cephalotrichum gorgonifer]